MIKKAIKNAVNILLNPEKEFARIEKRTLETIVGDYFILLLLVGLIAGLANFIVIFINALYLDFFRSASVNYLRLTNYFFGEITAIIFVYLFIGSFMMFFLSIILKAIFRIKYTQLLKIQIYALSPFLLFSWIPLSPFPLTIWSVFLLLAGIKMQKKPKKLNKNSIKNRD